MKKLCLFLCVVLTLALFGCEKAPAEQTVPATTVPIQTTPPTTLPPETAPPTTEATEATEPPRAYVPQDPDPLTYPEGDYQGTLALFAGMLYVHDNRPDTVLDTLPEGFAYVGISAEWGGNTMAKWALSTWHIPNWTEFYANPDEPNFVYYQTEEGFRQMIRAGLVENYWGGEEIDPEVPENYLTLFFESLLHPTTMSRSIYNQAAGMEYKTPADVNIGLLFYNGFQDQRQIPLTEEEQNFLKNKKEIPTLDNAKRLPTDAMSETLERFFGLSLADTNKVGAEDLTFWSKTNCYYVWRSDSRGVDATVSSVNRRGTETFEITYTQAYVEGQYVMTLNRVGNTFQILSNMPPAPPPEVSTLVTVTDEAPEHDKDQNHYAVLRGQDNEYFQSTFVHPAGYAAIDDRRAFDGTYFYICTEDSPRMRGNHHDAYVLYDAWMEKLETHHFRNVYTLYGREAILEFDYVLIGEKVIITWYPHEGQYIEYNESYGLVADTSRGMHELLIRFALVPGENYICYYASLDLETGKLNYFLSQFDVQDYQGNDYRLLDWKRDGDLLVSGGYPNQLYYFDIQRANFQQLLPEVTVPVYYLWSDNNGIYVAAEERAWAGGSSTRKIPFIQTCSFFRIDPEAGTETLLLKSVNCAYTRELPVTVYYKDNEYHFFDLRTGEDVLLPNASGILDMSENAVIYVDRENREFIYDIRAGETVEILWPKGHEDGMREFSPDGSRILSFCKKDGSYQLAIYNCQTQTVLEIQRTNAYSENDFHLGWTSGDSLIVYVECSENTLWDIVVYELK